MDIKLIREKIDRIDSKLLELIAERFSFLPEVVKYKNEAGLDIKDEARERAIMERQLTRAKARGLNASLVRELFELIFEESRRIQDELKD